jgi:hypothetical protein
MLAAVAFFGFANACETTLAQSSAMPVPSTTIVVFADRPMPGAQWTALVAALRNRVSNGGEETRALGDRAEFMRGDSIVPGIEVDAAIVVFLHGDCTLFPVLSRPAEGAVLGWVRRAEGRIEPFAHVDCTQIKRVLGAHALGMNKDQRATAMAEAMARVVVHEWIHIALQSPAHTRKGIEKAQYGVADLIGEEDRFPAQPHSTR